MIEYGELVDPVACHVGEMEEAYLLSLGWATPVGKRCIYLRARHAAGELETVIADAKVSR